MKRLRRVPGRQALAAGCTKTLFLIAGACLLASTFSFADTAILVALPAEQSVLAREVRTIGQSVELAQHRVAIGYHKGEKLYIVRTGAGNLNSAMVTQALLTRYHIDRVISIGVAGNLNDAWHVGDTLLVTNVVSHQEGKETPAGFEPQKPPSASNHPPSAEYTHRTESLQSNALEMARATLTVIPSLSRNPAPTDSPALRQGTLVSGDSFIASTARRTWLRDTFHADAVDMVSVGIAHVCEANGVPYVILRLLSDNADESASATFIKFVQSATAKDPITVPMAIRLVEQAAPRHP